MKGNIAIVNIVLPGVGSSFNCNILGILLDNEGDVLSNISYEFTYYYAGVSSYFA